MANTVGIEHIGWKLIYRRHLLLGRVGQLERWRTHEHWNDKRLLERLGQAVRGEDAIICQAREPSIDAIVWWSCATPACCSNSSSSDHLQVALVDAGHPRERRAR